MSPPVRNGLRISRQRPVLTVACPEGSPWNSFGSMSARRREPAIPRGLFYYGRGFLPDAESAFYFSGTTYTTVGYGDHVLTKPLRMLAPLEALTGILMCGLSTGLFFALVSRWIGVWMKGKTAGG